MFYGITGGECESDDIFTGSSVPDTQKAFVIFFKKGLNEWLLVWSGFKQHQSSISLYSYTSWSGM
jgi:hypothetical protein